MRKLRSLVAGQATGLVVLGILGFLVAYPIAWILIAAVHEPATGLRIAETLELFSDRTHLEAAGNSLVFALSVGAIGVVIGVPLAWLASMTDFKLRRLITVSAVVCYAVPSYVTAIAYLLLLGPRAGRLTKLLEATIGTSFDVVSFPGLIAVAAIHLWPLVYFVAASSFAGVDQSLVDASRTTGASEWQTAVRIVVPLVLPGIASGFVLAYIFSLVLFSIPLLIGIPAGITVLTTDVFQQFSGIIPKIGNAAAISMLFLVVTIPPVLISRLITKRRRFTTSSAGGRRLVKAGPVLNVAGTLLSVFVLVVGVVIPIGYMLAISVSETWLSPLQDLTSSTYWALLDTPLLSTAIRNSFLYAATVSLVVALLATVISRVTSQRKSPTISRLTETLTVAPLAIPGVVLAVGYILGFGQAYIPLRTGTRLVMMLALIASFVTVGYRAIQPTYVQLDPAWFDAAKIAGARYLTRLRTIELPLLRSGIVAGMILVFVSVMKELPLAVMLSSGDSIPMSAVTVSMYENGFYERMAAISVVQVAVVFVFVGIVARFRGTQFRL